MSFGLVKFIRLPQELYIVGRRTVVGQRLQFTYDGAGNVVDIRHDGELVPGIGTAEKGPCLRRRKNP